MKYREAFDLGKARLLKAGVPDGDLDAELLLESVCGTTKTDLLVHGDSEVTLEQETLFLEWIQKREARIPLQHIIGRAEFMGLSFKVNEDVLCPRQDTELLVEEVLKDLHDGMRILDMCTGSGCILISLLRYSNDCIGVGVDLSKAAIRIAEENAASILDGQIFEEERISFLESDLFDKVEGKFDILVSNPPYIPSAVIPTLMEEVKFHEPLMALDGKEDGLYFYQRILENIGEHLYRGGHIYFEIGYDQGEAVKRLMEEAGFKDIVISQDYAGKDRVVSGGYYV